MSSDDMNQVHEDLERYGVWVKAGPDEITDQAELGFELTDLDDLDEGDMLITEEEEKMLGELEESALPDFTEDHDTSARETDGESTQLLHKIEGEISALRGDVLQLKDELASLRSPEVSSPPDNRSPEVPVSGGFFDDEDDETIALTGDELDNILDSAEMTEGPPEESADTMFAEPPDSPIEESVDFEDTPSVSLEDDITGEIEVEDDPAISILGDPEDSEEPGDHSETIEIYIPGPDEKPDTAAESADEDDDTPHAFEEAVNQEIISMTAAEAADDDTEQIPSIGDISDISMDIDMDESESVAVNLSDLEHDSPVEMDASDSGDIEDIDDIELDEISLDDFASPETEDDAQDIQIDEIDLSGDDEGDAASPGGPRDILVDQIDPADDDLQDIQIDEINLEDDEGDAALPGGPRDILMDQIDTAGETRPAAGSIDDIPEINLDMDEIESVDQFALDELDISAEPDGITAQESAPADAAPDTGEIEDIISNEPGISDFPTSLREEIRDVLTYMDDLLESLPEEKVEEFVHSEHYEVYKKIFKELGIPN